MSRKNLLLTLCLLGISCYKRSWLIFIIVKMMLIMFDERWKAGLIPSGALFHLSHLGPEFRVLCYLTSVPNRVWGAMGAPCFTYLASYIPVVARADLHLQRVCAGWIPSCFQTKLGPGGHSFLAGPRLTGEGPALIRGFHRLPKPC